tara:strand:- start:79 stop:234 length:156 start_codon:yes stop_codon:yes gene_type:complete
MSVARTREAIIFTRFQIKNHKLQLKEMEEELDRLLQTLIIEIENKVGRRGD